MSSASAAVVNTEWYRIFMYAAQFGNVTKAAQKLHITQPSASYAIKQLEEALGVILFDRLSKGVKLTYEGQLLLESVEMAFSQLEHVENELQLVKQFKSGLLRIGASGSILKETVLPVLDHYHQQYPEVRVRLLAERTKELVTQLKARTLEIAFVHLPVHDPDIEIKPLTNIRNCFVVSKAFNPFTLVPVSTAELIKLPLLMLSQNSATRNLLEHWFTEQGFSPASDMELNSTDLLIEFAMRGYGAAFVSRSAVSRYIEEGSLYEIVTQVPLPDAAIGVATKKNSTLSAAASKFIEQLEAAKYAQ
ncbi:DNA-binding transcriptional LysR family regulator [Paenibacillus taihuensis]|uniref:DNA-binding transcriptional LysR family regulator n=1 Tax=Paenibacillus taihuensis TaxID=1156355 RepID=A0A3D9R239_9BACL|nr:LysR family transcriptional regulator [Paenibacillus taihuensis]REE68793.1 DNA-binding transcriptional LysR family regulator [Paenibacillus taihuensis]